MQKLIFVIFLLIGQINFATAGKPIEHTIFNDLLNQYVDNQGLVNYNGFMQDSIKFNRYLDLLSKNAPDPKTWSKNEQKAFWINAYNAFTIKIILMHYPITSIKDIKRGIPFINTTWDIKFIKIGTETYDLNNLEHGILRPKFKDSRVHFAVNCASISCPKLRNEAYNALQLDAQLDDQARAFLADTGKNKITANEISISKIFSWYSVDFPRNKIKYLNQYAPIQINAKANRSSMDYDWGLNEQK